MRIVIERVTPPMAYKWLDNNIENNRRKREADIQSWSEDMRNGRWIADSGDTISFRRDGKLIDGQHRLHALIRANVEIDMAVAYDVSDHAINIKDTGNKRTFSDALTIEGNPEPARCGAIIRWVINFEHGKPTGRGGASFKPSSAMLRERYNKDPELFTHAATRASDLYRHKVGPAAAAGTAFYLFHRKSSYQAEAFFDMLITGANLPEYSPILILRNRLLTYKQSRYTSAEILCLYVRAWNNYRSDTPVAMLFPNGTDKQPINNGNFPKIK